MSTPPRRFAQTPPPSPRITATAIRVRPGVVIWRHGRAWSTGEVLHVMPNDAETLVRRGAVERV